MFRLFFILVTLIFSNNVFADEGEEAISSLNFGDNVLEVCGGFNTPKNVDAIYGIFDTHSDVLERTYTYVTGLEFKGEGEEDIEFDEFLFTFRRVWISGDGFRSIFCGHVHQELGRNILVPSMYDLRIESLRNQKIFLDSKRCIAEKGDNVSSGEIVVSDIDYMNARDNIVGTACGATYIKFFGAERIFREVTKAYHNFLNANEFNGNAFQGVKSCVHKAQVGGVNVEFRMHLRNGRFINMYPVNPQYNLFDACSDPSRVSDAEFEKYCRYCNERLA